ncbi:TlpA family protein disulfide reductase [Rhodopirellula halodulae]|uniref:TlpA family protein disulfide reductase n=1 Tax=Rhodopirellula halodulae TaxID=2894198 RepID=UPI001E3057CD|nr:TlpA disulfide reductase family protein [Rhodopirellula sp. JC737]MCC9658930.1 TlpA family protein disulfide reductase [Rhodopirellula sp. JC737]
MDRISFSRIGRLLLLPAVLTLGGCGSSGSEPGTQTPSDSPAGQAESETINSLPPETSETPDTQATSPKRDVGGFSLPEGDLPDAPKKRSSPTEGGLSLPDDLSSRTDSADDTATQLITADAEEDTTNIDYATWKEVRKTAESTGKVTVVDVWSLACGPCLKEFPNLVSLQKRLGDKVVAIGANVDFDGRKTRPPESYEPKVRAFLQSSHAEFENYIVQTPSDEVFEAIGIGSIPAVLVFDAKGKLVKQFADVGETAGFTYAGDIVPLVEQLLK